MKEYEYTTEIADARAGDGYGSLLSQIRINFEEATKDPNIKLFYVGVDKTQSLYDTFLDQLPEGEIRQHYNCDCCRHFVNRFGRLVTIDPTTGLTTAIMWIGDEWPELFAPAVKEIHRRIQSGKIVGPFVTSEKSLGTAHTGPWSHMSVDMPPKMIYRNPLQKAHEYAADICQDASILKRCISIYSIKSVESAVNMLRAGTMQSSQQILPQAEWLLDTLKTVRAAKSGGNIAWLMAATAPKGFCHVPGNVLGTLLDDIDDGMDGNEIVKRFNAKMDPTKYQRPTAAPTSANVKRAEEIVEKLGIAKSLERRYAKLEDLKLLWAPAKDESTPKGGVFGGVITKDQQDDKPSPMAPAVTMTFEKFRDKILPTAKKMKMQILRADHYMAFTTAVHEDAPPILRWDTEENRYPVSWYMYQGGSYSSAWGLTPNTYVEVTGLSLQPNMMAEKECGYKGEGACFILNGCRDVNTATLCLFPDTLRGELHEVRATIEQFSNQSKLSGHDEGTASGVMIQNAANNRLYPIHLIVTTDTGDMQINIDRWE